MTTIIEPAGPADPAPPILSPVIPTTLEAAARLAATTTATIVGGGTFVVPESSPDDLLLALHRVPGLSGLTSTSIGAMATLADVIGAHQLPACLREAATLVGGPAVRELATIGGNAIAMRPGCLATGLAALDAHARVRYLDDEYLVPVSDFPERANGGIVISFSWPEDVVDSGYERVPVYGSCGPPELSVAVALAAARRSMSLRWAVNSGAGWVVTGVERLPTSDRTGHSTARFGVERTLRRLAVDDPSLPLALLERCLNRLGPQEEKEL